jgi:hypothetical protein
MNRLEAAEMRFLRGVAGYTRLDEARSQDIRQELEISGIQDVRLKYKQNWTDTSKEWTTPDCRNTPSPTNLGEEGNVDVPGKDGNASMPEQVKRPNTWKKMMMMTYTAQTLYCTYTEMHRYYTVHTLWCTDILCIHRNAQTLYCTHTERHRH